MWATTVVMRYPLGQYPPQMPLVQRDHEIQTLTTRRANQSFAEGVRLRGAHEDDQSESRGVIEAARLDPTLAVERQLLAEEEILGGEARVRAHAEREKLQEITEQSKEDVTHHRRADDTAPSCRTLSGFGNLSQRAGQTGQIVSARNFCGVQPMCAHELAPGDPPTCARRSKTCRPQPGTYRRR